MSARKCFDSGQCHLAATIPKMPECTGDCSIQLARLRPGFWRKIEMLAFKGNVASARIVERVNLVSGTQE